MVLAQRPKIKPAKRTPFATLEIEPERVSRLIECRAAKKVYSSKPVLRGIDLVVEPGICALLGVNGAGKSTLVRLLSGLEEPDTGSVLVNGLSFREQAVKIRQLLGVVPEGLGLFESLTISENLRAIGPIYGLAKRMTEERLTSLLNLLDLEQGRHTVARDCSFGMRKKTALAMALLPKPSVLILDEPFEGIDPSSSRVIQLLLRRLASDGSTILLTSHSLSVVQALANRVAILHEGKIASDFDPASVTESVEDVYFSIIGEALPEVPDWLRS